MRWSWIPLAWALFALPAARAADANRLTYLDGSDPYYPGRGFRETERREEDGYKRVFFEKRVE